ncbi:MAG: DUF167 family protein [Sulfuricella sp.]
MSDSPKTWHRRDGESIILTLHVQPGAKRTEVAGVHDGALKIKIGAAPVEGQANARLVEFLKKAFDVPASRVIIRQGTSGRRKVVEIQGSSRDAEELLVTGKT